MSGHSEFKWNTEALKFNMYTVPLRHYVSTYFEDAELNIQTQEEYFLPIFGLKFNTRAGRIHFIP